MKIQTELCLSIWIVNFHDFPLVGPQIKPVDFLVILQHVFLSSDQN